MILEIDVLEPTLLLDFQVSDTLFLKFKFRIRSTLFIVIIIENEKKI